jgi:hypothetical protein
MASLAKTLAISALVTFSVSTAWAGGGGPPCQPGEQRSGFVREASPQQNTSFIVHLTLANGDPTGPAGGIPLPGHNVAGDGSVASLSVNQPGVPGNVNVPGACDVWNETILNQPGNGNGGAGPGVGVGGSGTGVPGSGVGGDGGTPSTPQSSEQIEAFLLDPTTQKYILYNVFTAVNLNVPLGDMLVIPDLYAADSTGALINQELYGLVDLFTYMANATCSNGICEEPFTPGEAFTAVGGAVSGLPGLFFSNNPWTFTPDNGFVDPGDYSGEVIAVTQHVFPSVPEPATWLMFLLGLAGSGLATSLRRKSGATHPA